MWGSRRRRGRQQQVDCEDAVGGRSCALLGGAASHHSSYLCVHRCGFSEDTHARAEQQGASSDQLFTSTEVRVVLMAAHARDVAAQLLNSLDYIEGMLRSQLTTAIGKELSADDFDE